MSHFLYISLALLSYYYAPHLYDLTFCWWLALLYMLIMWSAIKNDIAQKNALSFNVLFSFMLFIVTFVTPLFAQTAYDDLPILFGDHNSTINKATALVVLAYSIYNYGWHRSVDKCKYVLNHSEIIVPYQVVNVMNTLTIIMTLIFVTSIIFFLRDSASDKNDIESGIIVLLTEAVLISSIAVNVVYNKPQSIIEYFTKDKLVVSCAVICILLSLYIGDRTLPLFLIVTLLGVYTLCVRKISLVSLVPLLLIAAMFFFFIGQTRKGENSLRQGGVDAFASGVESVVTENSSSLFMFADLLPASEILYLAYEYPKMHQSYFNPWRIIPYATSPIPYVPNVLSEVMFGVPIKEMSSAYVLTEEYSRSVTYIEGGLGTHIVGDIYVSWGIIGVIIFFYLFGLFIGYIQSNTHRLLPMVVYVAMLAYAVYLPRDVMYGNYRLIVYLLVVIWFCQWVTNLKITTKTHR